jgi:hypothetical protein
MIVFNDERNGKWNVTGEELSDRKEMAVDVTGMNIGSGH